MSEPSRPPPPKAYVPTKKPPIRPAPSGGELSIPPRPPPEDVPNNLGREQNKTGRGPPPPPAPYRRPPPTAKLIDIDDPLEETNKMENVKKQPPPNMRPAPYRPSKGPSAGPSPPARPNKNPISPQSSLTSVKKPEITVVSAQPMTSDVIPPPTLTTPTENINPPMPTEPPPDIPTTTEKKSPPTEQKTPPVKPNRSSPSEKKLPPAKPSRAPPIPTDSPNKPPAPKQGPAPNKPVRASPPTSRVDITNTEPGKASTRPSRGSLRKAPPPPAGRPPPPKVTPKKEVEEHEYAQPIKNVRSLPATANSSSNEYTVPYPNSIETSEYTIPVGTSLTDSTSTTEGGPSEARVTPNDYTEPVTGTKTRKLSIKKPPPPPTAHSKAPPPPTSSKMTGHNDNELSSDKTTETKEKEEVPTSPCYAEVGPGSSGSSQTSLTNEGDPPPIPSSPRPRSQRSISIDEKKDAASSTGSSRPRPPPPGSRPKPPPPSGSEREKKSSPTSRPKPPPPQAPKEEGGNETKTSPSSRPKPPPPRAPKEEGGNEMKPPPTSRPKPPPPQAKEEGGNEKTTPPTSRPKPPPPRVPKEEERKATPSARPKPPPLKPRPKSGVIEDSGMEGRPPTSLSKPVPPRTKQENEDNEKLADNSDVQPTKREEEIHNVRGEENTEEKISPSTKPRPRPPKFSPPEKSLIRETKSNEETSTPKEMTQETKVPPTKKTTSEELSDAPLHKPHPLPPPAKSNAIKSRPPPPTNTDHSSLPGRPSGPSKAPPPGRPGQGPKPKPSRPSAGPPPKPSKPSGPPRPTPSARKNTTGKDDAPPPLPPRPEPGHPLYRYVCPNPHGIAKTNKESSELDELSFYEGDVIELLEKYDDHWYHGCNVDNDFQEGLILAGDMKIIKRLPGQDKVIEDGPCAVSIAAFEGRSSDELSFKEGVLIMLISRVGGEEWLRGRTVHGQEGIFPKAFVEVVEELPPDAIEEAPAPVAPPPDENAPDGPYCVAIETFAGETSDDLSFLVGDIIEITERIDDDWLRGTTSGKHGMFPQVFVQIKVDTPVGIVGGLDGGSSEKESGNEGSFGENVATAVFDYEGQEGDLAFKEGDKITILYKVSDEWVYGELHESKGMFPSSFVDHIPDNLPPMKEEEIKDKEETDTQANTVNESHAAVTGECEALFDYQSDSFGDLLFSEGEKIIITEWINDEWLSGTINTGSDTRSGMFPVSFVKITKELPKEVKSIPKDSHKSQKQDYSSMSDLMPKAKAIRDFEPSSSLEMRVQVGDIIILLSKEGPKWFSGENTATGEFGNVPVNSVEVIVPLP